MLILLWELVRSDTDWWKQRNSAETPVGTPSLLTIFSCTETGLFQLYMYCVIWKFVGVTWDYNLAGAWRLKWKLEENIYQLGPYFLFCQHSLKTYHLLHQDNFGNLELLFLYIWVNNYNDTYWNAYWIHFTRSFDHCNSVTRSFFFNLLS